jgi:preprotein translocase subunit SecA
MTEHNGLTRYNKPGLVDWANGRFGTSLSIEEVESKSKADITQMLMGVSKTFVSHGQQLSAKLDELLNTAYGPKSAQESQQYPLLTTQVPKNPAVLNEIATWANHTLNLQLVPDELAKGNRTTLERTIRNQIEQTYRYEIHHAERSVALETLDTSWKDHLYFMDQLKSGIGLVGYAQKDPKVEYRREGMRAFEQMWDRIASQVTGTIFRIAVEIPEPTADRWQITSQVHESPIEDIDDDHPALEQQEGGNRSSPGTPAVEPIRNFGSRVGRNDPCPCGSGKKYKKCHGAT